MLGSLLAFAYSERIVYALKTWWVDAVGTRDLHVTFLARVACHRNLRRIHDGAARGSGALRRIGRQAPRAGAVRQTRAHWMAMARLRCRPLVPLVGRRGWLLRRRRFAPYCCARLLFSRLKRASGRMTVTGSLGVRYTSHRPGRAVLCIALIASATFLIVAVDSFRRPPSAAEHGYRYFAESASRFITTQTPQMAGRPGHRHADAKWLSFRLRPGDDASCLNLYQPQNPRVLGAPASWMKLDAQNDGTIPRQWTPTR